MLLHSNAIMQMNRRMAVRIVPLVLFLIYMYLPDGQPAEQQEVDIGINQCTVTCIQRGAGFATGITKLSCYLSRKEAKQWSMRRFAMSFASDIDELACPLSNKDVRHRTMRGFVIFSKQITQVSSGSCPYVNCKSNTRCVERRRGGAVCVENWKSTLDSVVDNDGEDKYDGENNDEITRTSDKGRNPLESKCSTNTDCPADRKFVCFHLRCKCELGYSFNPSNNSCVRRCKSYGDTFTTYLRLGIKSHNDRNMKRSDAKECGQHCIREKTFTCITYETHSWKKRCYISKSGYLDVASKDRLNGAVIMFWKLSVRNCA